MADFAQTITTAYATDGAALDLGRGVHDGAVVPAATVKLPLRMVNRHGLIAGATGTGKTKTLQGIAEQLSAAGVPSCSRSCPRRVTWISRSWRSSSTRRTCCSTRPPRRSCPRWRRPSG